MTTTSKGLASEEELNELLHLLGSAEGNELGPIDAALAEFPSDARLYFLKGSILAGRGDAAGGHRNLSRAVELAPDFAIARFQLGFFELTSGEPERAVETWRPLGDLESGSYLRHFVAGLHALIEDRFADCVRELRGGILVNGDNLPLNHDMGLIVHKCIAILGENGGTTADTDAPLSDAALLLNQRGARRPN